MDTIAERLREERLRLKLNQEDMATVGGVKRRAQINYESGIRCPDGHYFSAIAAAGADVQYILTGVRSTAVQPQPSTESLNRREQALLDNYRHTPDEEGKKAIEQVALIAARADRDGRKKRNQG